MTAPPIPPFAERTFLTQIVVGISDFKTARAGQGILVTHSLGSCLGVTVYDPSAKVGGLLHALLPSAVDNENRAKAKPAMFVDSGFYAMVGELERMGAQRRRMQIKLAGAGQFLDPQRHFQIGEKNYSSIKQVLRQEGLRAHGEDCNGSKPRSLYLDVATGNVWIRTRGKEYTL